MALFQVRGRTNRGFEAMSRVARPRGACPIACDVSGLINTDRRSTMPVFLAAERPSTGTLELLDPRPEMDLE